MGVTIWWPSLWTGSQAQDEKEDRRPHFVGKYLKPALGRTPVTCGWWCVRPDQQQLPASKPFSRFYLPPTTKLSPSNLRRPSQPSGLNPGIFSQKPACSKVDEYLEKFNFLFLIVLFQIFLHIEAVFDQETMLKVKRQRVWNFYENSPGLEYTGFPYGNLMLTSSIDDQWFFCTSFIQHIWLGITCGCYIRAENHQHVKSTITQTTFISRSLSFFHIKSQIFINTLSPNLTLVWRIHFDHKFK